MEYTVGGEWRANARDPRLSWMDDKKTISWMPVEADANLEAPFPQALWNHVTVQCVCRCKMGSLTGMLSGRAASALAARLFRAS